MFPPGQWHRMDGPLVSQLNTNIIRPGLFSPSVGRLHFTYFPKPTYKNPIS